MDVHSIELCISCTSISLCFLHQYKTFYRILKEAERREKLEIAKREKEVKHQLFMEEKKRKQEEKQEEKMKKLQEIEMKRQQNAIMKEQVTIFRFLFICGKYLLNPNDYPAYTGSNITKNWW